MRTTKSFTTTLGKELVLNEYITERENRELKKILMAGVEFVDTEPGAPPITKIVDKDFFEKQQDKLIEFLVVSYDNETNKEKLLEMFLDLPKEEFDSIVVFINEVQKKEK